MPVSQRSPSAVTRVQHHLARRTLVIFLGGCVIGSVSGCKQIFFGEDPYQDTMMTQGGRPVAVYRDLLGRNYYFDNGAKVFVNQGDSLRAPDRPTQWREDK